MRQFDNVVVSVGCWKHYRNIAQRASAMVIRGKVEAKDGVVNVVADKIEELVLRRRCVLVTFLEVPRGSNGTNFRRCSGSLRAMRLLELQKWDT